MRKALIAAGLCLLPMLSGCALPDMVFALLGQHYSEGGPTLEGKRDAYDRHVESAQSAANANAP